MRVPAICDNCGLVFPSGWDIGFPSAVIMEGNLSQCPRCAEFASVPDAILEILDGAVRIFSARDFTIEAYRALGIAVLDFRSGRITAHEASKQLSKVHNETGKAFAIWAPLGLNFLSLVVTIAMAVMQWKAMPGTNLSSHEVAAEVVNNYVTSANQNDERLQQARRSAAVDPSVNQSPTDIRHNEHPAADPKLKNRKDRRAERSKELRNGRTINRTQAP